MPRRAFRSAGLGALAIPLALLAAATAHAQSCGNNLCEPHLGEFDARFIPGNFCSVDCYCGNGTCDVPQNLDQVPEAERWMYVETASNCPDDCSTGMDCPVHYPYCSQIDGSPNQVPCPPGHVPDFLLGPHSPDCTVPDGLLPGKCFQCVPFAPPACSDGVDNDGDGDTDYPADADCISAGSSSEGAGPGVLGCDDSAYPYCGISTGPFAATCSPGQQVVWSSGDACSVTEGGVVLSDASCYGCESLACPDSHPSCGVQGGDGAATCPAGQRVEWSSDGEQCSTDENVSGRCFTCVEDDGGGEDPPMCTGQPCAGDADCPGEEQCEKTLGDSTKDACWLEDGACVKKCRIPRCVNNFCVMAPPEGTSLAPFTSCNATECPAAKCGDGVVQSGAGEECDDRNPDGGDGCSAACKREICGDGVTQPKGADGTANTADDEQCDDGNRVQADGCSNTCKLENCGNGIVDHGELCDDGALNSDTVPGACRTNCMPSKCGDGIVDTPRGEQCDCGFAFDSNDPAKQYCNVTFDGHAAICHAGMCQAYYCGDGQTFPAGLDRIHGTPDDEMCDAGPLNTDRPIGSGECDNNAQCPGGICVDGECDTDVACGSDGDCGGGKCLGGRCRPGGCASASDCIEGFDCNNGVCETRGLPGSGGLCKQNSDCPSGFCRKDGICDAPPPSGDASPRHEDACRLSCKWARCGDGIVDALVGEKCDEGEAMHECQGFPQPSCSCAIPTWSGTVNGGETYDMTCCGDLGKCIVGSSDTCPVGCGMTAICGNGRVEGGEECDTSSFGSDIAYRPNGDGTRASFAEDDGRWTAVPRSIENKYTAIDHAPDEPDEAYIRSAASGESTTYFHLWDVPVHSPGAAQEIVLNVVADFGDGTWRTVEVSVPLEPSQRPSANDMNSAALIVQADADRHELTFMLVHSSRGTLLGGPTTLQSPVQIPSSAPISIDALELAVRGGNPDAADCHDCQLKRCGNFRLEPEIGEQCDDGNAAAGDGCTDRCQHEICALPA